MKTKWIIIIAVIGGILAATILLIISARMQENFNKMSKYGQFIFPAYGQDWLTEHGNDSIYGNTGAPSMEQIIKNAKNMTHKNVTTDITKVGEENLKLINRLTMVLDSCTQIIRSGDSSSTCDKFQRLENKYLKQLFNETRPDVEKILLD